MEKRPPISVYILTGKNAPTLERVLKSIQSFADEIVIVDSLLDEKTAEIGQRYATKFIRQPWLGFREQYRLAESHCSHEWRMFVDADEEVSVPLQKEIVRVLAKAESSGEHVSFAFPRKTYFLGRWIRHGNWGNDSEVRLYRKADCEWGQGLHAALESKVPVVELKNVLYHYSFEDIAHTLRTINAYSTTDAECWEQSGKSPVRLHNVVLNPLWRGFRSFFLRGGFRDGFPGFFVSVYEMTYAFFKYAKRWEKTHVKSMFPKMDYYAENVVSHKC